MRGISLVAFFFATAAFAQDRVTQGIEEFRQGKYADAQTTLEQALRQKPGDLHARLFLALSRAAVGGCDTAANDLSAAFTASQDADLRRLAVSRWYSAIWRTIAWMQHYR